LEIGQKTGDGFIGLTAMLGHAFLNVAMMIPETMVELDKRTLASVKRRAMRRARPNFSASRPSMP
ncbi:MAG: hypothetical protein VX705_10590, partial [Verrucomicrobiota bacterium]|nr:hypothetical protein [Verrucomicrobiota bacterium]